VIKATSLFMPRERDHQDIFAARSRVPLDCPGGQSDRAPMRNVDWIVIAPTVAYLL
jgi:hypothetical protein